MTYDVCVVGHATRDRIEIASEEPRVLPGGTVYYAGAAARRLGLKTHVITKMRRLDRAELLSDLEEMGISVRLYASPRTTEFVNITPSTERDVRLQKVLAIASPFQFRELTAKASIYLLGPLTPGEITVECVRPLASRVGRLALDVQGLVRRINESYVELAPNPLAIELLTWIDVIKASLEEACLLTDAGSVEQAARRLAAAGPSEVIITSGREGSHVLSGGRLTFIPPFHPVEVVDTTGCGDTYFAAYLARRLAGDPAEKAGLFASKLAGIKAGYHGAFRGLVPEDVQLIAA